jgi:hypothetical protein
LLENMGVGKAIPKLEIPAIDKNCFLFIILRF